MTLRQRLANRAKYIAWLTELAQFIASTPEIDETLDGIPLELTFAVQSKAEADEVIKAYGARPFWRDRLYMAEWNTGTIEWPGGVEPKMPSWLLSMLPAAVTEVEDVTFEMHFIPPITKERAANVRSAGGEG